LAFSDQSSRLADTVAWLLTAPWRFLQRAARAFERHREAALDRAELAALDRHVLADLGLKRSLIDPARVCRGPCA
jgi:uncharacterized protein YjiS (DUF1127 family)